MTDLSSFGDELTIVIFGGSGGIGRAVTAFFEHHPKVKTLYVFSRSGTAEPHSKTITGTFDLCDEESIRQAAEKIEGPVDLVFVATGMLHGVMKDGREIKPEKTWNTFAPDQAEMIFRINAIGPMLIAKHFLPKLNRSRKSVFAAISARVGSISDNQLGGWYSYRASKAALNQMIRTASIELKRRNPLALCVGLHPGTVDSDLSKPFQGNVPEGKLFTPDYSAESMIRVLDDLSREDSGKVFAWDGNEILS